LSRKVSMRFPLKTIVCLVLLLSIGVSAYGQSILQDAATRRISQETGIDQRLVNTLFVDEAGSQFILAFIYINEESVNGDLKPDIREAIVPFVGRNAVLVLLVPATSSFFDPFAISFAQNFFRINVEPQMITQITPDFTTGTFASGAVSSGIIALDTRVLVSQTFDVQYSGFDNYSATFSLTAVDNTSSQSPAGSILGGIGNFFGSRLVFFVINLILLFLFPFLLL